MLNFKSLKTFFQKNSLLVYLLLFLVCFAYFLYFQLDPTLADPDSFYHAKMAVLMKENLVIQDFPWLQFTTLKNLYVDHHFLYHVFLIPFVTIFDPLVGIKFSIIILGGLAVVIFYWFLRKFQIKNSLLYCLLLLITAPFMVRANLGKAPMTSLIVLILATYFIFKKKHWWLLFLSFFYVWLYGGWPLILLFLFFYLVADVIKKVFDQQNNFFYQIIQKIKHFWTKDSQFKTTTKLIFTNAIATIKENKKIIIAIISGILLGLIINPYFPKTFIFYLDQTFKIAIADYGSKVGVGAEWYPYDGFQLLNGIIIVIVLWVFSLIWYTRKLQRKSTQSIFLWLISFFFFLYTLKARRQIEYFVPFALLCCAFSLNDFWSSINWKKYWQKILNLFKGSYRFASALIAVLLIIFTLFFVSNHILLNLQRVRSGFADLFSFHKLEKVSLWLEENTPKDSIIFNNNWDEFPPLFYYNTHNYYITGLAMNFMYSYDKDLCWEYTNIVRGDPPVHYNYKKAEARSKDKIVVPEYDLADIIKNRFNSSYVLISERYAEKFEKNIQMSSGFEKVYEDEEATVYKIQISP